jgi:hypothetical protein
MVATPMTSGSVHRIRGHKMMPATISENKIKTVDSAIPPPVTSRGSSAATSTSTAVEAADAATAVRRATVRERPIGR